MQTRPPLPVLGTRIERPKDGVGYVPLDIEPSQKRNGHCMIRLVRDHADCLSIVNFRRPGIVGVVQGEIPADTIAFEVIGTAPSALVLRPITVFENA